MGKSKKPSSGIRSPKVTGTINKTVLRDAVKKVSARRINSDKKTSQSKSSKK